MNEVILILTMQLLLGCHGEALKAEVMLLPKGPTFTLEDDEKREKPEWKQRVKTMTEELGVILGKQVFKNHTPIPWVLILEEKSICPGVSA